MIGHRSWVGIRAAATSVAMVAAMLSSSGPAHAATDASTIGIVRPESSDTKLEWHLRNSNSSGGAHLHFTFGNPQTGFPIVGDWNGDGRDTIGVTRPESSYTKLGWHLRNSNSTGGTNIHFTFGNPETGFPVVGDWNGDGKDTIGIVRDDTLGNLEWHLRNANSNGGADLRFTYGSATTGFPVTGDWNG